MPLSRLFGDFDALQGIIDAVPHPIFVKDEDSRFVAANRKMCELMGRSFEDFRGKTDYDFVPRKQADIFRANDRRVIEAGETNENEELLSDPQGGQDRVVITRKQRLTLANGARFVVGCITDITAFRRAEAQIRYNAEHDYLTGLVSRSLFQEMLAATIAEAIGSEEPAALLLIDLDGFKNVNDVLGHAAGDEILRQTASILGELGGHDSTIARLGGDEFALIQRSPGQPEAAIDLATALIGHLSKPMAIGPRQANITASIGIAFVGPAAADRETLMRHADLALYGAKRDGRNAWRLFEVDMEVAHLVNRVIEDDLRSAVQRGQFSLVFQPFVSTRDRSLRGYEALVHWHHPIRGAIDPALFIPIAEQTGLIAAVGEWALREACAVAARWRSPLRVSINVSAAQFAEANLTELMRSVIRESGIDARRIDLEITETAVIRDIPGAQRTFAALKALGVHIVLDDFGAGYSSLHLLKSLPFDKIKIDRSLLRDLGHSPRANAIVGAILQLSRTLNLPAAAEGVETEEQLAVLRSYDCDEVQGFLIGKPEPAPVVAALAAEPPAKKRA